MNNDVITKITDKLAPKPPSAATANSIVRLLSVGVPLPRVAEILEVPLTTLNQWLEQAELGDKRYNNLRQRMLEVSQDYEISLLSNLRALGDPTQVYRTVRRSINTATGEIEKEEIIESQQKPDYRALTYLLKLQSEHYREADQNNLNVTVATQTIVQLPDNGRPIDTSFTDTDD